MKALGHDPLDIVITGVGGQGNVLASQVLGRALLTAGYEVTVGETYGLSQRGGPVMSQVRLSSGPVLGPLMPEHRATAIVSLEPLEALRVLGTYGHPDVIVITNDRPLRPLAVLAGEQAYPGDQELKSTLASLCARLWALPATEAALELGNHILANVVLLGALCALELMPIGANEVEEALASMFPEKLMGPNRAALARGAELLKEG
ncbi:MAG: indolepyruvate oxidoreductase subunit beta [Desulfarculaceae bacterium]|nr:indolepyruvate oxidoreductase subunit beta [Desulfarculaceae bacterium]MCF8071041.1 indolepyruvate oxidoreductase subunit beta [Desulfarculaceae bacterium]MCF8100629.1 indolepyruvate oxidoreductase subunit beta [Desulfarculaceae bacterium]MCF8116937.1 indolepyruvate oxidoreductase subunit beta [Desulfarculaceae bacterium]